MKHSEILTLLPYSEPFLFVDSIEEISDDHVVGSYTFRKDSYFYKGHFKNTPVTPGVIITECMAQIGLVCLSIFSNHNSDKSEPINVGLAQTAIDFFAPVFPGEKVTVHSEKEYFRFGKLKCRVSCKNAQGVIVASGTISGMSLNLNV